MAIVWPCAVSVDEYVAAGRGVRVPRQDCPDCAAGMTLWAGYWRHVRDADGCRRIFVPRFRCAGCAVTHALLPAFVLRGRLDVADTVGQVLGEVLAGPAGVRPAAVRVGVPHTTARGWVRRFAARAGGLAVAFAALGVELGGEAIGPAADRCRWALGAIGAAFAAAGGLPGWARLGCWRFACAVSGGTLIAANTTSPYLIVGKRRFMPPIPLGA